MKVRLAFPNNVIILVVTVTGVDPNYTFPLSQNFCLLRLDAKIWGLRKKLVPLPRSSAVFCLAFVEPNLRDLDKSWAIFEILYLHKSKWLVMSIFGCKTHGGIVSAWCVAS